MCKMTVSQWLVLFVLFLKDVLALKDVVLTITPNVVQRSQQATLKCAYDLEGASLYYVKWYRGNSEFYRYTLSERPPTKVFPYVGINVDVNHSNSTQVVLIDIDFQLAGNFSCEVTTGEEPASTRTDTQSMLVVQLPEHPPRISVGREPLDYGDVLRANCSSPPANPPANLTFILNNFTVAYKYHHAEKSNELLWSDLPLELELNRFHFSRGKLILRCVAQVAGTYYHEEAVLELQSARDPKPEKVSAVNSASLFHSQAVLPTFLFFIMFTM